MGAPVEAWRISVPDLKDNFKDVLQRKKFKHARHQKNHIPLKKMNVLQMKLQKPEEKIDKTQEKIDVPQEKIDKPLKKNNIQLEKKLQEKIDNTPEKNSNPLGKSVEQQEHNEKSSRQREKECDEVIKPAKSKTCCSDQPGLRCKKTRRVVIPSVSSISQSVNMNCRHCCCALGELFKEICKRINGESNARVGVMLNEISDILRALANDCVLFLRRIGMNTTSRISKVARPMQEYVTTRVKRTQKYTCDKVSTVKDTSRQYAKKVSDGITATIDKTKQCAENASNSITAAIDKTKQCAENASNSITAAIDKTKQCAENASNSITAAIDKTKQCAENASTGITAAIDKTKQCAENASNGITAAIDKTKQCAGNAARLSASGDMSKHQHAVNAIDELKNKIKQKLKNFKCQKCN